MLRLLGISDTDIEVTTDPQFTDPFVDESEFDTPALGTRFVAIGLSVRNVGRDRLEDAMSNGARLVLTSGTALNASLLNGCSGIVEMAPGETRLSCVAFEVPFGVAIQQFEFSADSGFGQETGVWR